MPFQTLLFRTWAVLCLALGLLHPALAQRHNADEGEYQILQARYGTASQNVDVTQRLKELARSDREFRVSNDSMGVDPHPYEKKTLRIYARGRDGQTRTFEYREEQRIDGAMFTGWGGGNWGQSGWNGGWDGEHRPHGGERAGGARDEGEYLILEARYGTASRNADVTQRLKALASQDRPFEVSNNTLGVDPHPYEKKTLRIYARGRDGQTRTFEYREEQRVDGSQFIGWAGGKWGQGGWGGGWGDSNPGNQGNHAYGGLTIVSASYGAEGRVFDLTQRLRGLVRNGRLEVTADNNLAGGDPAPYKGKTLWVTFRVGNGPEQQVAVEERQRLSIP